MFEHLRPRASLVAGFLARAGEITAVELVNQLTDHLAAAVITKEEDRRITAAGLGSKMPPGGEDDVWSRYRAAGLDVTGFGPQQHAAAK